MNKLPCKGCICLPVCKAIYREHTKTTNIPPYSSSIRTRIQSKCSTLEIYMLDKRQGVNVNRAIIFHDFMKFGVLYE